MIYCRFVCYTKLTLSNANVLLREKPVYWGKCDLKSRCVLLVLLSIEADNSLPALTHTGLNVKNVITMVTLIRNLEANVDANVLLKPDSSDKRYLSSPR